MSTKEQVYKQIEDHYRENYDVLVKQYMNRAGGRHNAEDIVQEAYTRACQYWKAFDSVNGKFEEWFYGILKNCIIDKFKEEVTHGMVDQEEGSMIELAPRAINKAYLDQVLGIINKDPHAHILRLYFLSQFTDNEISQIVPQSPVHVRVIVWNFRKKLRGLFKGSVFE